MGREGNIFSFEYMYLRYLEDIQMVEYVGLQLRRKVWAEGVVSRFINL